MATSLGTNAVVVTRVHCTYTEMGLNAREVANFGKKMDGQLDKLMPISRLLAKAGDN